MKTNPAISAAPLPATQIDPRWTWHYRTLLRLRQKLIKAQAQHETAASSLVDGNARDQFDAAEDEIEHEVILAELHAEHERLHQIDMALGRIGAGTYGICAETGAPISAARLRAIPWTLYSVPAAARREHRPTKLVPGPTAP